jgi:tellurite resistance protein
MADELSPEEQQELENLRQVVERAIADGVLTQTERDGIMAVMKSDGKVTFEELCLVRQLVSDKVASGELQVEG